MALKTPMIFLERFFKMRTLLVLALLLFPVMAQAHDGVHVKNAYAYATSPNATTGAVFLKIVSPEATHDDTLTGIATPVADKAELHSMTMDDKGVMQMRPMDKLSITHQVESDLTPTGNHIMLTGLKAPLKAGDIFPLTLTFEREGAVDVKVTVKSPTDTTPVPDNETMPGMHGDMHMDHHDH